MLAALAALTENAVEGGVQRLRERGGEGEEFTVLDRAGRLQLPRDHVERYGLRGRVRLTGEAGHVGVWPDRDDRTDS